MLQCMNQLKYPQFVLSLEGLELPGPCLGEVLVLAVLILLLFFFFVFFALQLADQAVPVHSLTSAA